MVVAGASSITAKELKEGPTIQVRFVKTARVHPYYNYSAGAGTPDDIAVLGLETALTASSAVTTIGLPSSASSPGEGTGVSLSGYGEENPSTEELNEKLYSLAMTLVFPRRCGGEADALFLCAASNRGSACFGDSGGPVTIGPSPTLVGLVDTVEIIEAGEAGCALGAVNGFVNLASPEIRKFVQGSEEPPLAPRGGRGLVVHGVIVAGHVLSCEPGAWSNNPTFTYAFINSAHEEVLQRGASDTYGLSEADVGRTIRCLLEASNAGGTGVERTFALPPIKPAPTPPPAPPALPAPPSSPPPASGGVLASAVASVGTAEIEALLKQELTPTGKAAKIAALLKTGGLTIVFQALEAGTAVIEWYRVPPGARLAGKARPVLVASGQATFTAAGTLKIKMKLTPAGKRLLKRARSLKLTARGIFSPSGEPPVSATKVFVLKR